MKADVNVNACVDRGDDEAAKVYLKEQQELNDKIDFIKNTLKEWKENADVQKEKVEVLQQQLNDLNEVQAKLQIALKQSYEQFYSLFKKIKLSTHKDRVMRTVMKYPQNQDEFLEREDEKLAAAAGMAFMQAFGEHASIEAMVGLVESHINNKQGENNGSHRPQ